MNLHTVLRRLGRNLKEARRVAGLTQIEVHSRTGITYRHYQNIEAGRVNVTLETLVRLANVFHVTLERLLHGA
jgi:transcriptional regulator with XRE-family HTH domain